MRTKAQPVQGVIDKEYRQTVRAAAGNEYLRAMTDRCLASVNALVLEPPAVGSPQLVRELHRLAGGTAAVGLPLLSSSLRALEHAYEGSCAPAELSQLWERCRSSAQACGAALSGEES